MTKVTQALHAGFVCGELTLIAPGEPINNKPTWLVRCNCGVEKTVREEALKSGNTQTCGAKPCIVANAPRRLAARKAAYGW